MISKYHRHFHSPYKRAGISFLIIFAVMVIGTGGIHLIENDPWVDAFYMMSMIATAQGPASTPHTDAGKIFLSIMSFVSVGSVVASLGFLFGPFLGVLFKIGVNKFEEEIRIIEGKKK